jgi:hypothetical protein
VKTPEEWSQEKSSIVWQWLGKYISAATDTLATIEELWEALLSMWYVPRRYKHEPSRKVVSHG